MGVLYFHIANDCVEYVKYLGFQSSGKYSINFFMVIKQVILNQNISDIPE